MAPELLHGADQASDRAALAELWTSFVSLVRSYAAAAQFGQGPPQVLVSSSGEHDLELVSSTKVLRLTLEDDFARGYWALYAAPPEDVADTLNNGAFRIGLDSRMEWTGLPGRQEMDAVAEALATLVLE